MIKPIFMAVALLACSSATAEIIVKTACYVGDTRPNSKLSLDLAVRTYIDTTTNKEIGAFAQYNHAKTSIPLVFVKFVSTDTDSPELGNYELTRVEVVDKKVTGEYVFIQTGAGIRQGRYVKYKSANGSKSVILQHIGGESERGCAFND